MSHIDKPEDAALVKNKWSLFWGATGVAAVLMIIIAAAYFASQAGNQGNSDTQGRIEVSLVKVTEVPMHPKCKSGSIHLPYGFKGYLETGINKELEVWFLDGRHIFAPTGKPVDFGDHPNNRDFQVRGDEGILRIEPKI